MDCRGRRGVLCAGARRGKGAVSAEDLDAAFLRSLPLLFVEDDPGAREEIGRFLAHRVGRVITASDGVEGLAAFKELPAPIVVTDIHMPNLDGIAMAQEIRSLDPDVLIIVTTAFDDWDNLTRSIATGIDQYVVKPIQSARLYFALLACAHRLRTLVQSRNNALSTDEQQHLALLTAREREVLAGIGNGQSSRMIAQGMGISPKTVHAHQANLMIKLGLHKCTALAAFAVRAGIR